MEHFPLQKNQAIILSLLSLVILLLLISSRPTAPPSEQLALIGDGSTPYTGVRERVTAPATQAPSQAPLETTQEAPKQCTLDSDCEDENPCTDSDCISGNCFVSHDDTNLCNDGDAATANDRCIVGHCTGDVSLGKATYVAHSAPAPPPVSRCDEDSDCDDGNPCTNDSCRSTYCMHLDNSAPCEDGLYCTVNDTCLAGTCDGIRRDCSDGDTSTLDNCDEVLDSCIHPQAPPCTKDSDCDDANQCTNDDCASGYCAFTDDDTNACDDGDPGTSGDRCILGTCVGTDQSCSSYEIMLPSLCYKGESHTFDILIRESLSGCESAKYAVSLQSIGGCITGYPPTVTITSEEETTLEVSISIASGEHCEAVLTLTGPGGDTYESRLFLYNGPEDYYCPGEGPAYCSYSEQKGDLNNDSLMNWEDVDYLAATLENATALTDPNMDYNHDGVADEDDVLCMALLLARDDASYASLGCPGAAGGALAQNCDVCGCLAGYACLQNRCVLGNFSSNEKDMRKYTRKGAFIVSNGDWKSALELVPVSVWTGLEPGCQRGTGTPDGVCTYPLLIYHQDDSGFDADAVIRFMQDYEPTYLMVVGETPQELDNLIVAQPEVGAGLVDTLQTQRIKEKELLLFWRYYEDIVYCADDYETALVAAAYASLLNAPLVVKGSDLDEPASFTGKNVICVGVGGDCDESYTLEELQKEYLELTGTKKVVVVNPNDINFYVGEDFETELSGTINQIYGGLSLAAPVLAAAKHELIIAYNGVTESLEKNGYCKNTNIEPIIDDARQSIVSQVESLYGKGVSSTQSGNVVIVSTPVEYLTIIAAPNALPDSRYAEERGSQACYSGAMAEQRIATDRTLINGSKTGRIYSLTVSDISAYIARSIFYSVLSESIYGGESTGILSNTIIRNGSTEDQLTMSDSLEMNRMLSGNGYDISCVSVSISAGSSGYTPSCASSPDPEMWTRKQLMMNWGHGAPSGWGDIILADEIPKLSLPYGHAFSCSTAFFWYSNGSKEDKTMSERFGARMIRQGAMGYHGLTGMGSSDDSRGGADETCPECIPHSAFLATGKLVTEPGTTLGDLDAYMYQAMANYATMGFNFYTLLGDPTLALNLKQVSYWGNIQTT